MRNRQSRYIGKIGHTRQRQTKQRRKIHSKLKRWALQIPSKKSVRSGGRVWTQMIAKG